MRLTTDFWVSALMRRVRAEGGFAYLTRRGANEAGAVFILWRYRDDLVDLYAPAPQSFYSDETSNDERFFVRVITQAEEERSVSFLEKELRFDPDIWLVELESYMPDEKPFILVGENTDVGNPV